MAARSTSSTWRNWAGTVTATPAVVHRPRGVDDVVAAVRLAATQGARLRPRGSGHSFTPLAATDEHAIDLGHWTGVEALDTTTRRVRVRAGTTLRTLNAALDAHGLALANLGDIDAQTVSGAVATGTHGTGARLGGLATQIAALDLVLADGTPVHCAADEHPDLFAAARVSLGALGVVTHVTLQCVPAFTLRASERPEPGAVRACRSAGEGHVRQALEPVDHAQGASRRRGPTEELSSPAGSPWSGRAGWTRATTRSR